MALQPLHLRDLDFSVLQQCIHCGMCLPVCPTYDATKLERNSPRGRIALMKAVAAGQMEVSKVFAEEMYFCLGCLACETACPAGVAYAPMFESARADIEGSRVLATPARDLVRSVILRGIFSRPRLLQALGRLLHWYQASGLQNFARTSGLTRLLPARLRALEPLTPKAAAQFSAELIEAVEAPEKPRFHVGMLTGCVQDIIYPQVNRDTVDVLLANGCTVVTPRAQNCCGSLAAHNGELALAREMARRNIRSMEAAAGSLESLDAIISNAAGCGTQLKQYGTLLQDDPAYAHRARIWSSKVKDIHEWLAETGPVRPDGVADAPVAVAYHEACHLCHGQKISRAPRTVLELIPGLQLTALPESDWCCGSAGIYNITQPEMSRKLLRRKLENIGKTPARIVASANPGCNVQLEAGVREAGMEVEIVHPVTLLARAYRNARP